MDNIFYNLDKLITNAKKSIGRKYTAETLKEKHRLISEFCRQFGKLVSQLPNPTRQQKIDEFRKLKSLAIDILKEHSTKSQNNNMASFNLETTAKALPLFSGNHTELESFLITAELIHKTLSNEAKVDFLQYIYHAKLTSNVRTAIGSYSKPENFELLKSLLEKRYKSTKTIPELQNKLLNLLQGKMSVNVYKEKILQTIDNMNKLGIEDLGQTATTAEKNVIIKLNNKLALDTFKKGLNDNLKSTIYASRPTSLQEASDLAIELENENKANQNVVLQVNTSRYQRNHNRTNNQRINSNYSNNYYNNPNRSNPQRNNNNHNNIQTNRNNNYNNNNNNRNNNNINNNNPNRNNFRVNNNNRNNNNNKYNNNYNNNRNNNRNGSLNDRRQIHCIHKNNSDNQGNTMGAEYEEIPDRQN